MRNQITGNAGLSWGGDWTCGKTFELHVGSLTSPGRGWVNPSEFPPRLLVHDSNFINDRLNWNPDTTMQYVGLDAIFDGILNDDCEHFIAMGGPTADKSTGTEFLLITFNDGSFM